MLNLIKRVNLEEWIENNARSDGLFCVLFFFQSPLEKVNTKKT